MLNERTRALYDAFYEATHDNEFLDGKTEVLVGLAAAIALDCQPCTRYYLARAKSDGIKRGELSEVLAKVMAVAAGQKRLQTDAVLDKYGADLSD